MNGTLKNILEKYTATVVQILTQDGSFGFFLGFCMGTMNDQRSTINDLFSHDMDSTCSMPLLEAPCPILILYRFLTLFRPFKWCTKRCDSSSAKRISSQSGARQLEQRTGTFDPPLWRAGGTLTANNSSNLRLYDLRGQCTPNVAKVRIIIAKATR